MKDRHGRWIAAWRGAAGAVAAALLGSNPAAFGQTVTNSSFETNAFGTAPGYVSVNGPIAGWSASLPDRAGLNPAGGSSLFADNGATPHGAQVAFLQGATGAMPALSTVISGLTPGQNYKVNFRLNARTNATGVTTPNLKAAVDNTPVLGPAVITAVGGTAPYRYIAFDFNASASEHTLSLTNAASVESALLLDDFSVGVSTSGWSSAVWTNDASSGVDGSRYYTHAYNFDSTAAAATINGVTFTGLSPANPTVPFAMYSSGFGSRYTSVDLNTLTTNGGGSAALASRFIYGGYPESITIGGLVPGVEYLATVYTVGWADGATFGRAATFYSGEDRLTVNQNQFGENFGHRISYRYVAPSNGVMSLSYLGLSGGTVHTYGFSNCESTQAIPFVVAPQPVSQASVPGATATFRARAAGSRPLFYQWLKDGAAVAGATNAQLNVAVADASSGGGFSVIVSNGLGSVTSSVATLSVGMIANPSFEADSFFEYPGYCSANGSISGWVGSNTTRVGLNPVTDGRAAFADNGAVPDGSQVAFIQSSGSSNWLSTALAGLTAGQTYTVSWRINARAGQKPKLHPAIDGQGVIVDMQLSSVGTTNPYRYAAFDFTATAATHTLSLTNDAAGDVTALVDDFRIQVSTSRWSYAAWNNDASSGVDASRRYTHAYNFGSANGADVNGVHFTGLPGANPSVPGALSVAGFPSFYLNDFNNVRTAGGGGGVLARDFIYNSAVQSITMSNLVPGVEYVATMYGVAFDSKTTGRAATFDVNGDRMTINLDHFDLDNGIRVSYRYVADATGRATLTYQPTEASSTFHTYAFSNYELTSTLPPNVYEQPRILQWASAGSDVVLQGLVGGQEPLFLQWQKDGVALPGQTNVTLALSGVSTNDAGVYTLVISNALGTAVTSNATVQVGLPVGNPSFEADAFLVAPGYVGGNFPITAWANSSTNAGLNPVSYTNSANNPAYSPFANNGVIPDGRQVAFLQADSAMSQVITGFNVGATYEVKYYENSRSGYAAPSNYVTVGGATVVPLHGVTAGVYRAVASVPFVATNDALELAFVKSGGEAVLIDCVGVLDITTRPPGITLDPRDQSLAGGDPLHLEAAATGGLPMGYRWQRDGVDLPGQTNAALDLAPIALDQGGAYRMIVTNLYGAATSAVASVQVNGLLFSELFNSGVDDARALAAAASADLHYLLTYSDDPAYPGPAAVVMADQWPVGGGAYMTNGPSSKWLSPMFNAPGFPGNVPGTYTYSTTFLLDTMDPASSRIDGRWAMDNMGVDIRLNGTSLGITAAGHTAWSAFVVTNGFQAGTNTLEFVTSNSPPAGPTALRVELRGVGQPLPAGMPQILGPPRNQLAQQGGAATFEVVAAGAAPLTYQWYRGTSALAGETNRLLRMTAVDQSQEGGYRVVAINGSGPVTSTVATLTVNRPPVVPALGAGTPQDKALSLDLAKLLLSITDPDGDTPVIAGAGPASAQGGTAVLGTTNVTYTPPAGYVGADSFSLLVTDGRGGTATGTVTVAVTSGAAGSLNIVAGPVLSGGLFSVTFAGVPGYTYTIESTETLIAPVWLPVTNMVAPVTDQGLGIGVFQFTDPAGVASQRYYRTVSP